MPGLAEPTAAIRPDSSSSKRLDLFLSVAAVGVLVVSGLAILSYAYIGHYTRYWQDDFCIASHLRVDGFWGSQSYYYNNITGHVTGIFINVLLFWVGIGIAKFFPAFELLLWVVVLSWAFLQVSLLAFGKRQLLASLVLAEVVIVAYLAALPDHIESVYWLTASAPYTGSLIAFSLYVGLIAHWLKHPPSKLVQFGSSLALLLLAGSLAETYSVWQVSALGLAVVGCVYGSAGLRTKLLPALVGGLIGALVALAVLTVAPGNEQRLAVRPEHLPITKAVSLSFGRAYDFIFNYADKWEILLVGGVAFVITLVLLRGKGKKAPDALTALTLVLGAVMTTYVLIAACYAPSYYLTRFVPLPRGLTPAVLTVIGLVGFFGSLAALYVHDWLDATFDVDWTAERTSLATGALALALLIPVAAVVLPVASKEFGTRHVVSAYAAAWDERDREIRRAKRDGELDVMVVNLTHMKGEIREMSEGITTGWVNNCIADYYGVKSVQARPSP